VLSLVPHALALRRRCVRPMLLLSAFLRISQRLILSVFWQVAEVAVLSASQKKKLKKKAAAERAAAALDPAGAGVFPPLRTCSRHDCFSDIVLRLTSVQMSSAARQNKALLRSRTVFLENPAALAARPNPRRRKVRTGFVTIPA